VHIEDYARAYVHAIEGAAAGKVIAVVDDVPTTSRDAMHFLADITNGPAPRRVPPMLARVRVGSVVYGWATQSARTQNARARKLLGWQPRFSSVKEGLPEVLARCEA
jgi:2-alkyl-3-oxoalkanoate reductase